MPLVLIFLSLVSISLLILAFYKQKFSLLSFAILVLVALGIWNPSFKLVRVERQKIPVYIVVDNSGSMINRERYKEVENVLIDVANKGIGKLVYTGGGIRGGTSKIVDTILQIPTNTLIILYSDCIDTSSSFSWDYITNFKDRFLVILPGDGEISTNINLSNFEAFLYGEDVVLEVSGFKELGEIEVRGEKFLGKKEVKDNRVSLSFPMKGVGDFIDVAVGGTNIHLDLSGYLGKKVIIVSEGFSWDLRLVHKVLKGVYGIKVGFCGVIGEGCDFSGVDLVILVDVGAGWWEKNVGLVEELLRRKVNIIYLIGINSNIYIPTLGIKIKNPIAINKETDSSSFQYSPEFNILKSDIIFPIFLSTINNLELKGYKIFWEYNGIPIIAGRTFYDNAKFIILNLGSLKTFNTYWIKQGIEIYPLELIFSQILESLDIYSKHFGKLIYYVGDTINLPEETVILKEPGIKKVLETNIDVRIPIIELSITGVNKKVAENIAGKVIIANDIEKLKEEITNFVEEKAYKSVIKEEKVKPFRSIWYILLIVALSLVLWFKEG